MFTQNVPTKVRVFLTVQVQFNMGRTTRSELSLQSYLLVIHLF